MPAHSLAHRRCAALGTCLTALVLALSTLLAAPGMATTYAWNNAAGGAWSEPANWSPAGVPGAGDVASLVPLAGPYTVTLDVDPTVDGIELSAGPTLDLSGHGLAGVGQLDNAGRVLGLAGDYDPARYHNLAGGYLEVPAQATLTVHNTVDNAGTIAVRAGAVLWVASSVQFTGSGTLQLESGARVDCPLARPQTSIWLVNAAGHTVSGAGDVWLPVENHGLLRQDRSQGALLTVHQLLWNYGTVRVANQGAINVDYPNVRSVGGRFEGADGAFTVMMPYAVGGTLDLSRGGSLVADGGDLRIGMGTIVDGHVQRTAAGGAVAVTSVATPQNLTVDAGAELRIDGQIDLTAAGSSLVDQGTVRVRGILNVDARTGYDDIAFQGDGTVYLDGGTLDTPAGGTLVNGPGHTIAGCGTITANIDNQGTLAFDCGYSLRVGTLAQGRIVNRNLVDVRQGIVNLSGNTLVNQGRFVASGGDLKFQNGAVFDNRAGTFLNGNATVWFGVRGAAATFTGGTLATAGSGQYRAYGNVTLQDVTLGTGGSLTTLKNALVRAGGARFVNLGTNRVEAGGTFALDPGTAYAPSAGATVLAGGTLTVPQGLDVRGSLSGTGTVCGDVRNEGVVAPAPSALGLRVQGSYAQAAGGRLEVGLAGATPDGVGHLDVTGPATLAGTVAVRSPDGYAPPAGVDLPVMAFASRTGTFASVSADPGLVLAPVYGDAALTLHSGSPVGVGDLPALPTEVRLSARGTAFVLELPRAAIVHVGVYDATGRAVATLLDGASPAGIRTLDLRALARSLPHGIYFARATVDAGGAATTRTARLVYLR